MGRKYWCEFCQRSFSDILSTRKKHVQSQQHQKLRKLHYDSFKDPVTLLREESQKTPCKRFFTTGQCQFGNDCRYSHRDMETLRTTAEPARRSKIDQNVAVDWIEKWKKKKEKESGKHVTHLPPSFPPVSQLPPSLHPPMVGGMVVEDRVVEWG